MRGAAGGGGLLIRTLRNLENTPLGMQVDGLVVFGVKPKSRRFQQGRAFYREPDGQAARAARRGVSDVMEERLGSWWSDNSDMMVDGKLPDVANGASRTVRSNVVGPDFFTTLGVPVLAGRDFADSDTATSPHVGIINEEFAQALSSQSESAGPHYRNRRRAVITMTIVGVVKNHKYRSIDEEPIPMAWYMYAQIPVIGRMDVEMRVHGEPLAILPSARKVVQQMNPNLPLIRPMTQRAQYDTDHFAARCSLRGWPGSSDCWRWCWWHFRKLGYIPADKEDESVGKFVEYSYCEWACANVAEATGNPEDAKIQRQRSQNYRNLFDTKTQFLRPKLSNGEWAPNFDPRATGHVPNHRDYTEANAWQSTFCPARREGLHAALWRTRLIRQKTEWALHR